MQLLRRCTILVLLSFGLTCNFAVRATTKSVQNFKLANGLQIFVKENHNAPVVVSQIWYKVGSGYETLGITGISHALEHMMFQGTKKFPDGALNQIVAQHGGIQNASTSNDQTLFYQELPAKDLALSFALESDRMTNLTLGQSDFTNEMKVVAEERRMRTDNQPQALAYERFSALANIGTPYEHATIGWMDDIKNLQVSDIKQWYQQYYVPNNAILIVVGDVNPNQVFSLAKKYFGKIKSKPLPISKTTHSYQPLGERKIIIKAQAKLPMLLLGYNVPTFTTASQSWQPYALIVAASILDLGNSSRFARELLRKQKIAATAQAAYDPTSRLATIFTIVAIPTENHTIQELQTSLNQEIQKLQTTLISPSELARVKAQIIADKVFAKDSLSAQAMEIGSFESVGLSWELGENLVTNIEKITPEQVQAVVKEYFTPNRLTIGILQPNAIVTTRQK